MVGEGGILDSGSDLKSRVQQFGSKGGWEWRDGRFSSTLKLPFSRLETHEPCARRSTRGLRQMESVLTNCQECRPGRIVVDGSARPSTVPRASRRRKPGTAIRDHHCPTPTRSAVSLRVRFGIAAACGAGGGY